MKPSLTLSALPLLLGAGLAETATQPVHEQLGNPKFADVKIEGHVLEPRTASPDPSQLNLPPGFKIDIFARDLVDPRMLAVSADGTLYVTRRSVGDVLMLRDSNGDGKADERKVVANRPNMHGIAIDGSTIYLVTIKDLYKSTIRKDGTLAPLTRLVDDLPDAGQHLNRTVAVGPDGKLYLSAGSTCNACSEGNVENATLLQFAADGSSRKVYASGLRNTVGFGFEPSQGRLYGMDHGIDWLGDNVQHEELNHIEQGQHYGWPYIYGDGRFNPQDYPPGGITMEEWAAQSTSPVGLYVPHSAPMQMAFYSGSQFPRAYHGDAFVAMRGSWNRRPPSGYEVLRIRFEEGRPVAFEPFVTGFLTQDGDGWRQSARLAGLAQAADGALFLSDDNGGVIYRISYAGDGQTERLDQRTPTNGEGAEVRMLSPRQDATSASSKPTGLAVDILAAKEHSLSLQSSAIENNEPIPKTFAAEGEDISPPLQWQAGPKETKSYVIVMEDPDVAKQSPFVHWLIYNLPADPTELARGVPGAPKLEQPKGALQGTNDRGTVGYFGPRPPKGDSAHHYHFQLFALDTMLDLSHGASRAQLLDAMQGHVLASDRLTGTFAR